MSQVSRKPWTEKGTKNHLKSGVNGIALSISEIFGLRMRYPHSTPWTKEESKYIYYELPYLEPKILNLIPENTSFDMTDLINKALFRDPEAVEVANRTFDVSVNRLKRARRLTMRIDTNKSLIKISFKNLMTP